MTDLFSVLLEQSLTACWVIPAVLLLRFCLKKAPKRVTNPEACGLRHLAFHVDDVEKAVEWLNSKGIETEPIRWDPFTEKQMVFFRDPDNLPIELHG